MARQLKPRPERLEVWRSAFRALKKEQAAGRIGHVAAKAIERQIEQETGKCWVDYYGWDEHTMKVQLSLLLLQQYPATDEAGLYIDGVFYRAIMKAGPEGQVLVADVVLGMILGDQKAFRTWDAIASDSHDRELVIRGRTEHMLQVKEQAKSGSLRPDGRGGFTSKPDPTLP